MAQNKLDFSLTEQKAIRQKLTHLKQLYKSQLATITDIKEAESHLDQAVSKTSIALDEVNRSRKNLGIITGKHYPSLASLNTDREYTKLEPSQVNDWVDLAQRNNYKLVDMQHKLAIQEKEISIQKTGDRTTVDLFARYEGSNNTLNTSSKNSFEADAKLGLEIKIPLYGGNKIPSKVRIAKLTLDKLENELGLAKREINSQVIYAFQHVKTDIKNIRALRKAVNSAEAALNYMRQGKEAGTRTVSDVLSSLREAFRVKQGYINARYQYLINIVKLKQVSGTLSIDDLKFLNHLLNTNYANYEVNTSITANSTAVGEADIQRMENAWNIN